MIKIVFRVLTDKEKASVSLSGGIIHGMLEKETGLPIKFISFCGFSETKEEKEIILMECKNADVIIMDSWVEATSLKSSSFWQSRFKQTLKMMSQIKGRRKSKEEEYLFIPFRHDFKQTDLVDLAIDINYWLKKTLFVILKTANN